MEPVLHHTVGDDDLALIHVLRLDADPAAIVETVDAVDPRFRREDKAVIIVSTQFGCPVGCLICDSGGGFRGNLSADQILAQVRFVVGSRPSLLRCRKLKVHFARMGEPAFNEHVLEALVRLPEVVPADGLMPCLSTVAPSGRASRRFFTRLEQIILERYRDRPFQLQISIHATDEALRQRLIPTRLMSFEEIAAIGRRLFRPGQRKVALNFALARGAAVDVAKLRDLFDPAFFAVKLTPINPTEAAQRHGLETILSAQTPEAAQALVGELQSAGFETIVSIGEPDEIAIGSNCGQSVRKMRATLSPLLETA